MIAPTDLVGYSTFIPDRALTRTGYEKIVRGYYYTGIYILICSLPLHELTRVVSHSQLCYTQV